VAQGTLAGNGDAFVARLKHDLSTVVRATFLGGNGSDEARRIVLHPRTGGVVVAGTTLYGDLPQRAGGAQSAFGGGFDGFVSRLSADLIEPNPVDNHQAAYVTGAAGSQLCVANQPGICVTPFVACAPPCYATNWFEEPRDFVSSDYIAVRHTSANPSGTAETKLIISGAAYPFRSSTGNANIACNLDMNCDNKLDATSEGLILVRAMLGFSSDAVVAGTDALIVRGT
jgi:hypothetical protein